MCLTHIRLYGMTANNDASIDGTIVDVLAPAGSTLVKMAGSGWCSAGNSQEWKSTHFHYSAARTTCQAQCESELFCIGFWMYVSPSTWAGQTCTMFSSIGSFSGQGYGAVYDRNGKGPASSSSDFILQPVANCECWKREGAVLSSLAENPAGVVSRLQGMSFASLSELATGVHMRY